MTQEYDGFDFGEDPIAAGGSFKNPEVGNHTARLRSLIHVGMFADEFKNAKSGKVEVKKAAPFVYALFELKEDTDVTEEGEPLTIGKSFPLKKGDKAFLTTFMRAMLTSAEFAQYEAGTLKGGFGDLIGRCVSLDLAGGKEKNDDGTPKYVNIKGITQINAKLAAITDELKVAGSGFVKFNEHTEATVKELPAYIVRDTMKKSVNFPGSVAEQVVLGIEANDPEAFARKSKESEDDNKPDVPDQAPPPDLNADEEF